MTNGKTKTAGKGKNKGKGKSKGSSNGKGSNGTENILEEMYEKVLNELVSDLRNTSTNSDLGEKLQSHLEGKSRKEILVQLQDFSSDLCKAIPVETLRQDASGRKYLSILKMVQPQLDPIVVKETRVGTVKKANNGKSINETTKTNTNTNDGGESERASFEKVLADSGVQAGDFLSLTESIMKDVGLDKDNLSGSNMDITQMMNLMPKLGASLQNKIQNGDVDMENLSKQAMNMMQGLQNLPEMQSIMPMITSMMGNVGNTGNTASSNQAMPDFSAMLNMLNIPNPE